MMICSIYIRHVSGNMTEYLCTLNPCTFCCMSRLPANRDAESFVLSARKVATVRAVTCERRGGRSGMMVTGYRGAGYRAR